MSEDKLLVIYAFASAYAFISKYQSVHNVYNHGKATRRCLDFQLLQDYFHYSLRTCGVVKMLKVSHLSSVAYPLVLA